MFENLVRRILKGKEETQITPQELEKDIENYWDESGMAELAIKELAVKQAVNMIAGTVAQCEFRTFREGKEIFGEEWYAWNYEPNKNQTATEFIEEMVTRLLYKNECLIIEAAGQRIIAESFSKTEYAVLETEFTNVYRKGFTFQRTYKMSEVMYLTYHPENVIQLLNSIAKEHERLLQDAIENFRNASGEKGTLKIDTTAAGKPVDGKSFEEIISDLMNNRFKAYFKNKNAVLPLYNGYEYEKHASKEGKKSTSEAKDILDLEDRIFWMVAQTFQIPFVLFMGQTANDGDAKNDYMTFAIKPIVRRIEREGNRKLYRKEGVKKGTYMRADLTTALYASAFSAAESIDKLIADGVYNVDEIRRKLGEPEIGTEESKKYHITKNLQETATVKGGETDAD